MNRQERQERQGKKEERERGNAILDCEIVPRQAFQLSIYLNHFSNWCNMWINSFCYLI